MRSHNGPDKPDTKESQGNKADVTTSAFGIAQPRRPTIQRRVLTSTSGDTDGEAGDLAADSESWVDAPLQGRNI
jgi:hypothetical protein